jgi:hypothetical protein
MHLRFGLAAWVAALALGCATTPPEQQWTKSGATPEDIKRDLYWCSTLTRDPPRALDTPSTERRVTQKVDEICMQNRGYTKVERKG